VFYLLRKSLCKLVLPAHCCLAQTRLLEFALELGQVVHRLHALGGLGFFFFLLVVGVFFFGALVEHQLEETWLLESVDVLLRVLGNHASGVILDDLELKRNLLVEAHVRIVNEGRQELELISHAEALSEFDDLLIQGLLVDLLLGGDADLHLFFIVEDNLMSHNSSVFDHVANNDPPALLLQVWVVVAVHVSRELFFLEIGQLELELNGNCVTLGHLCFTLREGTSLDIDYWHDTYDFLDILQLLRCPEVETLALLGRQTAESVN
jgi:hypothetical protein